MPPASTSAQRVEKRRAALRAQGLRPIQIWVPDSRAPGFAEECARQAAIVDAANRADPELMQFMDAAAVDLAEHLDALEAGQPRVRRGDLITVALQGEHGKPRPALVIQSDLFAQLTSTVTVALLTSTALDAPLIRVPVEPSERNGLRTRSYVMIDQIFSARTRRVGQVFGHLDDADMLVVNRALALFVGIAS